MKTLLLATAIGAAMLFAAAAVQAHAEASAVSAGASRAGFGPSASPAQAAVLTALPSPSSTTWGA
jgi:hypothetical protein